MFIRALLLLCALAISAQTAMAAGLSPLRKQGTTASDKKGFYVAVLNPYPRTMTYELELFEADMETPASGASVFPARVRVGAKRGRKIMLSFDIPKGTKERTIVLCAQTPDIKAAVTARVCGTYTGRRYGARR